MPFPKILAQAQLGAIQSTLDDVCDELETLQNNLRDVLQQPHLVNLTSEELGQALLCVIEAKDRIFVARTIADKRQG